MLRSWDAGVVGCCGRGKATGAEQTGATVEFVHRHAIVDVRPLARCVHIFTVLRLER
jgi:hypothetical protein